MALDVQASNTPTDLEKVKSVIEKRLIQARPDVKATFPPVLRQDRVMSAIISEPEYLMIVFLTELEEKRFSECVSRQIDPFVGLITTGPEKATFRAEKARYVTVRSCAVTNNSFSFSLGPDSTILLEDHYQTIETEEVGKVSYKVSLAFIMSYGDDINHTAVHEYLDGLVAYSTNIWRENLWFTSCAESTGCSLDLSRLKQTRN
jgi:hypothetical protein